MYLYFPLVVKEFVTEKDRTVSKEDIFKQKMNKVNCEKKAHSTFLHCIFYTSEQQLYSGLV